MGAAASLHGRVIRDVAERGRDIARLVRAGVSVGRDSDDERHDDQDAMVRNVR